MTDDDDPAWRAFCVRMASMIGEQRTAMGAEAAAQDGAQPLQLDIVYCAEPHPHPQPQPQPLLLERWRLASEPNDGPASAPAPATPQPVALAAAEAAVRSHLHFSLLARCRGHLQLRPAAPDAVPDELKPQRRVFPSVALAGGRRRGVVEVTSATLLPDVLKAALPPVAVVPAASRTSSAGSVASTGAEGRVDGSQARQRQVPLGLGYYGALHHKAQQHRDADGTSPDGATSRSGTPLANGNGGDTGSSTASPSGSPVSPAAAVSAASTGSAGSGGGAHVGRSFSRPAMAGSPDPRRRMLGGIPTAALPASPSAVSQPKAIPRRNTDSSTSPLGIRRGSRLAVSADTQLPFGLVSPPMFSAPGGMRRAVSEVPSVSPTPHSFRGNIEESLLQGAVPGGTPMAVAGFTAKLSAAGMGRIQPQVKLPLAVTFYQLANDVMPTPYVGVVDLERELSHVSPAGHYVVPKSGQIQVIICNPEKTGLKVFVVPYNFSDMPPKTHTFLRQRTIVHYPAQKGAPARRTLSFVIHICFTCNKQGRLFLHRSVRVVFSGAAPDKEAQLETVLEGPKEPVYSPWPKKRRPQVEAVAHGADSPGVTVESKTRGSRNTSNGGVLRKAKGVPTTLPKLRSGPTSPSRPPPLAMDGPVPFILDADGCCMPSPTENGSSKLKSPKSPQRLVELTTNAGGRSVSVVSLGGFGDGKSKVADGADGDPLEDDALY